MDIVLKIDNELFEKYHQTFSTDYLLAINKITFSFQVIFSLFGITSIHTKFDISFYIQERNHLSKIKDRLIRGDVDIDISTLCSSTIEDFFL